MNVTVSLMEEKHIDEVVNISNLSFNNPWSKESYLQELKNPVAKYFVATTDGTVVGFIGAWIVLDEAHITNVAVHPDFRRLKVGSILLDSLLTTFSNDFECISYDLEVRISNTPAQKLYSKYGFKEIGVRKEYYRDNKEDALLMCR
ncbi:MAG: ribosomal-protein-alanine N-acetyltransferase [Clostridium butyricum]|nr:ribosomal-protein-alanine N-acetyltransferase [Clostridium butyricum]